MRELALVKGVDVGLRLDQQVTINHAWGDLFGDFDVFRRHPSGHESPSEILLTRPRIFQVLPSDQPDETRGNGVRHAIARNGALYAGTGETVVKSTERRSVQLEADTAGE